MPLAIQLAHAGRKTSTRVPWEGGAELGARVAAPPQYWRAPPRQVKDLFETTRQLPGGRTG